MGRCTRPWETGRAALAGAARGAAPTAFPQELQNCAPGMRAAPHLSQNMECPPYLTIRQARREGSSAPRRDARIIPHLSPPAKLKLPSQSQATGCTALAAPAADRKSVV